MSFFSGSSKLSNTSPIPSSSSSSISKAAAVALLQDHEFFLHCDPHYASHKVLPPEPSSSSSDLAAVRREHGLPAAIGDPLGAPPVKLYEVVDHVPNPVWSSNVVSREEFVDFADGLWVRIRSPMGVVMETTWTIREATGKGEGGGQELKLELVEDVDISCSKLLLGIVRGQVEANWKGIHKKIIDRLVEGEGSRKGAA